MIHKGWTRGEMWQDLGIVRRRVVIRESRRF
jgi:hypothetical protein